MKKIRNSIYCRTESKGTHTFYLRSKYGDYFLFCQDYRSGANEYFKRGVALEDATDYKKSRFDNAIIRTMSKIYMYIKYTEKENGIEILNQTIKKNASKKKCA